MPDIPAEEERDIDLQTQDMIWRSWHQRIRMLSCLPPDPILPPGGGRDSEEERGPWIQPGCLGNMFSGGRQRPLEKPQAQLHREPQLRQRLPAR